jgi:transketolase
MVRSTKKLRQIANEVRQDVVEMVFQAGSGHLAGSLSGTDVLVVLFFGGIINYEAGELVGRDRFILSAGHYCPAFCSVLSRLGYFPKSLLWTLRDLGSPLQGHPHKGSLPGIELSSGALGQGLSVGVGKALGLKVKIHKSNAGSGKNTRVFVLMSDGEQNEGQVWEAAMTASKYQLDNLIAIVDKNGIQSAGMTTEIMPLEDLREKYEAFGWKTEVVDGHDLEGLSRTMKEMRRNKEGKPKVIIAETVAGKGVSFLENDYRWHAKPINQREYQRAFQELAKRRC